MLFVFLAYEAATETKIYTQLEVRMPRREAADGWKLPWYCTGRQQLKTTKSGVQVRATASGDEVL